MGIFDFVKNAGAKIFGKDKGDNDGDKNNDGKLDVGRGLSGHLRDHGIDPSKMKFTFDGGTVIVEGTVPDQDTREKTILIVGNVEGVGRVDDRLHVGSMASAPQLSGSKPLAGTAPAGGSQTLARGSADESTGWTSRTYTVEKGDTLSGISKKMYGEANKYNQIFEANKPMLKDPDKIYPGQVLRIPAEK
jgi:nucleoid-associated protein YgaU